MSAAASRDLVILVADRNIEFALRGVLSRPDALKISPIEFEFFVHPERDPGCFLHSQDFLASFQYSHRHALVVFDLEFTRRDVDKLSREQLEGKLEERLKRSGWGQRAAAVVIDPELEVWVWSRSPHVDQVVGWAGQQPRLAEWLAEEKLWLPGQGKPPQPKQALERALRRVGKPRSSALYRQLAEKVSLERCTDPAFAKLRRVLAEWFGTPAV